MSKITKLRLCGKTSDLCCVGFIDEDGKTVHDHHGPIPDFFPGDHYGDYIEFDIDPKTGMITNWGRVSQAVMKAFIKKEKD